MHRIPFLNFMSAQPRNRSLVVPVVVLAGRIVVGVRTGAVAAIRAVVVVTRAVAGPAAIQVDEVIIINLT